MASPVVLRPDAIVLDYDLDGNNFDFLTTARLGRRPFPLTAASCASSGPRDGRDNPSDCPPVNLQRQTRARLGDAVNVYIATSS